MQFQFTLSLSLFYSYSLPLSLTAHADFLSGFRSLSAAHQYAGIVWPEPIVQPRRVVCRQLAAVDMSRSIVVASPFVPLSLSLCSLTAPSWFPLGLLTVAFIFHLPTWRHFVVCSVFSCLPPGSGCGCAGQPSTHIPPSRLSSFLWWTVAFVVFPITLTAPALYLPPTLLVF